MRSFVFAMLALGACLAACGLQVIGGEEDGDPSGGSPSASTAEDGAADESDAISAEGGPSTDGASEASDNDAAVTGPGSALRFASNAYVQIGAVPIPADFTMEAWVRPSAFGSERYIVAKDRNDENDDQFRLGHDDEGHLFFMMSDDEGEDHGLRSDESGYALLSPAALPLGTWSHVAVSKTGAQFVLYVDGIAVRTVTATGSLEHDEPSIAFRIGARLAANGNGPHGGCVGDSDEVRLWNGGRTAAEIASARGAPLEPSAPGYARLVAYYRFDEGTGSTAAPTVGTFSGSFMGGGGGPKWIPADWP